MAATAEAKASEADAEDEKEPLASTLAECTYATMPKAVVHTDPDYNFVARYDPQAFSTFRVIFMVSGTVLDDTTLWLHQIGLAALMVAVACPLMIIQPQGFSEWADEAEPKTRSFMSSIQTLCTFLLSFYVSLSMSRWWACRTAGVGQVAAAARDISAFLASFVTRDENVIAAVHRYTSASLLIIYLDRIGYLGARKWQALQDFLYISGDEREKLEAMDDPSVDIWAWITEIVGTLYRNGKLKNNHCQLLMKCCASGSQGIAAIKTSIDQQIPLLYVHLLSVLVKTHNILMGMLMGTILAYNVISRSWVLCALNFLQVFLTTFSFNAVLCIGYRLSDPFDGDPNDFNVPGMARGIEKSSRDLVKAGTVLPPRLLDKLHGLSPV